jgi:hypothetical protein
MVSLGCTYRPSITQEVPNELHNPINILVLLHKTQPLTPRQFANNIKGIILQPSAEIAHVPRLREQLLSLLQENTRRIINKWLIVDQTRHCERRVHAAAVLGMVALVRCAEERGQSLAFRDALLDDIEVGLHKALVQAIDDLDSARVGKGEHVGSHADNVAILSVQVDECSLGVSA